MESTEEERWAVIPGYEGIYSVSTFGRVRGDVTRGNWKAGRMLSPRPQTGGYLQVCLCKEGAQRMMLVHRLVMCAFVGPCPSDMEVAHADGDKSNNRLTNLRYTTRSDNLLDGHRYKRRVTDQKLTLEQVAEIRARLDAGEPQADIAQMFGVTPSAISRINCGLTWAHRLDQTLVA